MIKDSIAIMAAIVMAGTAAGIADQLHVAAGAVGLAVGTGVIALWVVTLYKRGVGA